jgi:hypothetical protein
MNTEFLQALWLFIILFGIAKAMIDLIKGKNKSELAILAFLVILLAAVVFWIYRDSFMKSKNETSGDSEVPDDSTEKIEKIEQYPNLVPFPLAASTKPDLLKGNVEPEMERINWNRFITISQEDAFIGNFHRAILESYRYKIDRYQQIINRVKKGKVAPVYDDVGDNVEKELRELISLLQRRLKSQTIDRTRRNLAVAVSYADTIVARNDVKDFLATQLYSFSKCPRVFLTNFQNIILTGRSGIGKTILAQTIGKIYGVCGILARGHQIRETTKSDFVTAYVNESGKLARRVLLRGLETIIFIDEAYDITPERSPLLGKGIDHGGEAVTEMVNFLDKFCGLTLLIAAGYKQEMKERFLGANEGMPRRFPHVIDLPQYGSKELFQICAKSLRQSNLILENAEASYLWGCIDAAYQRHPEIFDKQGGDAVNFSAVIGRYAYSFLNADFHRDYRTIIAKSMTEFAKSKDVDLFIHENSIEPIICNKDDRPKSLPFKRSTQRQCFFGQSSQSSRLLSSPPT